MLKKLVVMILLLCSFMSISAEVSTDPATGLENGKSIDLHITKSKDKNGKVTVNISWNNISSDYECRIMRRGSGKKDWELIKKIVNNNYADTGFGKQTNVEYQLLIIDKKTRISSESEIKTINVESKKIPYAKCEIFPKQFFKGDKITIYFTGKITGKMKKEKKATTPFYTPKKLNIYYGFNGWDPKTLIKQDFEMNYNAELEYFYYELTVPTFAQKINAVFKDSEGNTSEDFEFLVPNKNIVGKDGKKVEISPEDFYAGDKVIVYFSESISGKMKLDRAKMKVKNPNLSLIPSDIYIHYGYNNWDPKYETKYDKSENYSDIMMYNPKQKKFFFELEIPDTATQVNLSFKDEYDNYSEDFAFQVSTKSKTK